jgi:ketosteroid isomerase-like protein
MSEENVERFLEAAEAFNRGDIEGVLARYDQNIVFEPRVAGTYVGHDGVGAFLRDLVDLFVDFRTDYPDVRDLGDRVLALGTARGRGVESGVETELTLAVVATFRDGLLTHFKDYGDKDQALKAAGLSE